MGHGIKTFYPRIAFVCGDYPSQHRISGLSEGLATYGCTYCNYKTSSGLVYDPTRDTPRDITTISARCVEAEPLMNILMNGGRLSKRQKQTINRLTAYNIHPYVNSFHNAPMGYKWDIYKAVPPDLLHLFCAGLMKSMAGWALTIISEIAKIPNGKSNVLSSDVLLRYGIIYF